MRLLMVGPFGQVAMRRNIDWAVEHGMDVVVADLPARSPVTFPTRFRVVSLLPPKAGGSVRRLHRHSMLAAQIGALRLRALQRVFQPEVTHSYKLGQYTDMCLRAGLRPLIVSLWGHLSNLLESSASTQDIRWIRRLQAGADVLLVENPNLLPKLSRLTGGNLRIERIALGVDDSVFHPGYEATAAAWRFVLNIPNDTTVLFSPRGWSEISGQHHIMEAFALAYRRVNKPMVLVFVGLARKMNPEYYARQVLDRGVVLGVADAIRWVPQVQHLDMPGLYALADIIINYISIDAYPSTLVEVAACARPVITSAIPAYRSTFIEEFYTLVEPENPQALADAIVEMVVSGPGLWAKRVEQARQAVLAEHRESVQKDRLMALYHQIAAQHA